MVEPDGTPGQWYLHLFDPEQPDLDWTNDEVRAEFESILRFWLDRGVDGFRIDVAHGLAKDPEMPDLAGRFRPRSGAQRATRTGTRTRSTRSTGRGGGSPTPTPASGSSSARSGCTAPEQLARYLRPDELHTAFNFDFLLAPWDAAGDARRDRRQHRRPGRGRRAADVGAVQPRRRSATSPATAAASWDGGGPGPAALLMLALPGGAYVYQGEELGLEEVEDLPDEVRQDPTFLRTAGPRKGRDGCRVPIPWSGTEPPFGFGPAATRVAAAAGRSGRR